MTRPTRLILICLIAIIPLLMINDLEEAVKRQFFRLAYMLMAFAVLANLDEKPPKP